MLPRNRLLSPFLIGFILVLTTVMSAYSASVIEFGSATNVVREAQHTAHIPVRRSGSINQPAKVRYQVNPGTATPKVDYKDKDGWLVFGANEREKTISLSIRRDHIPEGLETVQLVLIEARGASLGNLTNAILEIVDDAPWISGFTPASATPGEEISIQGLNFTSGVTSVTFNGVPSSFIVEGAELIRATVPEGASTGLIVVTSSTGAATSREAFVVLPFITVVVTNTNDAGPGSLRQAILTSNAHPHANTNRIHFAIESGLQTIHLQSVLPPITHSVVIDGTTQPGFSGTPIIELDAMNAVVHDVPMETLIDVTARGCTIRGLVINNLGTGIAVALSGGQCVVEGNYIGPSAQGGYARDYTGIGVGIYSTENRIGGTTALSRNVISHTGYGIQISLQGNNQILGNFIGTDATGTQIVRNVPYGILLQVGNSNLIAGNLISGANDYGLWLESSANVVRGNFIGTDITGTKALPNGDGILVQNAHLNVIGGPSPAEGNLISGNLGLGIRFLGGGEQNLVQGNRIGTDVTGLAALGNGGDGISVPGRTTNAIVGNSIFGNGGLGINVISTRPFETVTLNDIGDTNIVQNFPVIDTAASAGGVTTLTGRLLSRANETFTLEFFSSLQRDPSGYGEGQFPLGTLVVTTDANGLALFTFVTAGSRAGQYATATARSASDNTSEFSAVRLITP
jgi:Calx-beta domain/Right handed beta helix region